MAVIGGNVLTILFTDVEGSTELLSREGDQVAGEVLRVHEDIVRRTIAACGGRENAFLGDGFLATFDTPRRGLRCAIAIQRALDDHNRGVDEHHVRVRIGLHEGDVIERDGQLYGRAIHAAARVMSEAAGGEILVSPEIESPLEGDREFRFVDRGLFWLKGFPERWRLYQVAWRPDEEARAVSVQGLAPFVGRDAERADLRRAFRAAAGGDGGLVLVAGEAGVGKTRLIEEVAAEAEARGMQVLVGHSFEAEGGAPYLPVVEILEEALTGPRSTIALRAALGDAGAEIARIVPGLRRLFPEMPKPLDLPAEQARRYLWESIREFLERAAQVRPLLLVVEDLHWADESTLRFLEYLAPLLPGMPILVIGSYRDVEVGPGHPLAATISQLARRRLLTRISLERLPEEAVAEMIAGIAGQVPPPGLVRAIHRETEGNPFFVEEVYLHLLESNALFDPEGRFREDLEISELDVPETVKMVIGGRLERLSQQARDTLLAAAVSGRVFDPEVVRIAAGLSADDLAAAYEEAEDARLVGPTRADPSRSMFVHELIRQTLLADASSLRRQQLHAATADAIERVHAADLDDHAADLARHLTESGPRADPVRLVRYLRMAGERAAEAAAFEDAVRHLRHALPLVAEDDRDLRAEILERMAMAQRSLGEWDEALATMDQALELYQALGRTGDIGRVCWAVVYQLAWAARFEQAVGVAGFGLLALGDLPNPDRARLHAAMGWVVGLAGDYQSATEMFVEARGLAERLGDERALADVLHMETIHHMGYVELREGVDTGRRAAAVFEREGALWDLCSVLAFVAYQQGTMGLLAEARETVDRAAPMAEKLGHLGAQFLLVDDLLRREGFVLGSASEVEAMAHQAIEVCERGGLPWLYVGHLYLGFAASWRGRPAEAEQELRMAVELEPPGAFSGQSRSHLAVHLAETGAVDEVAALLAEARPGFPVPGRVASLGSWNGLLNFVEALTLSGLRDEVAALAPLVDEALAMDMEWLTFDCHLVHTRAALAFAALDRWDDAGAHLATARRVAEQMGHRVEEAEIRRLWAHVLLHWGRSEDAAEAKRLLDEAIDRYRAMGMPGRADLAASML